MGANDLDGSPEISSKPWFESVLPHKYFLFHLPGLPLPQLRAGSVAVLTLATGTAVAQTGLIAFVGLAAPHRVRSVGKATHNRLIGLASLMGAVLLAARRHFGPRLECAAGTAGGRTDGCAGRH